MEPLSIASTVSEVIASTVQVLKIFNYAQSLVVKAGQLVGDTDEAFQRFTSITAQLQVSSNIFEHIFRRLLMPFAGASTHEMLANSDHLLWKQSQLETFLQYRLPDTKLVISNLIDLIRCRLRNLQVTASIQTTIIQRQDKSRSRMKNRFESNLSKLATQTRALNTQVNVLRVFLAQYEPPASVLHTSDRRDTLYLTRCMVKRFAGIQHAAMDLCKALTANCVPGISRWAYLRLKRRDLETTEINFVLLRKALNSDSSSSRLTRLVWQSQSLMGFTMKPCTDTPMTVPNHEASHGPNNKGEILCEPDRDWSQSICRTVRFSGLLNLRDQNSEHSSSTFTDLILSSRQEPRGESKVISILRHPEGETERRYSWHIHQPDRYQERGLSTGFGVKSIRGSSTSKSATIESGFSIRQRISLARSLAGAVLQFQGTPWLTESWSPEHIIVLENNIDNGHQTPSLDPYVRIKLRTPVKHARNKEKSNRRPLVRNEPLFSLGVMLLELAFERSLSDMRIKDDGAQEENDYSDFIIASRVQHSVSQVFGVKYAEAVRKCLYCDFGAGSDLSATNLQERFYQNVVQELQDIERTFYA